MDCFCFSSSKKAFSGTVAEFTDSKPGTTAGSYTAKIEWGDGQTTNGATVTGSNGNFKVSGSHTYANTGYYDLKITVTHSDGRSDYVVCKLTIVKY